MVTYTKQNTNIVTRYSVEYVDNKKDWEYICSGKMSDGEPWEHYKTKQFDNIDEAMSLYMVYLVRSNIYDIKLFEEIILDGETIRESYIEPNSTIRYSLKTAVNKTLYDDNNKTKQFNKSLIEQNNMYKAFIDKFNGSKMFNDFVKEYNNKTA